MSASIYRSPQGEAEIRAFHDEALANLGPGCESRVVDTRLGDTHVRVAGPEDAPPVVFLPLAGNFRIYAPDIVGQPGRSAEGRPSPKGDEHAWWMEDLLDGLGLRWVPLVGLSYEAGIAIRTMGYASERVSRAALVSPLRP